MAGGCCGSAATKAGRDWGNPRTTASLHSGPLVGTKTNPVFTIAIGKTPWGGDLATTARSWPKLAEPAALERRSPNPSRCTCAARLPCRCNTKASPTVLCANTVGMRPRTSRNRLGRTQPFCRVFMPKCPSMPRRFVTTTRHFPRRTGERHDCVVQHPAIPMPDIIGYAPIS